MIFLFFNQGMEVSTLVVKQKDLGCNATKVHMIDQDKEISDAATKLFWKTLGGKSEVSGNVVQFFIIFFSHGKLAMLVRQDIFIAEFARIELSF